MSGVVTGTSGHPIAGASVVVTVALSGSEQAVRAVGAFSTAGIFCLLGCSAPHDAGYSARDGSFALSLPGANPQHDDYRLTVAVARGSARVATSVVLPWTARSISGADVQLADSAPQLRASGDHRSVVPPPLPARYGAAGFDAALQAEAGSPPVADGQQLTVTNGYDARVVEDERLLLTTVQTGHEGDLAAVFSSSLEVHGNDVPASRGSSCFVTGSRGQSISQPTCGLTDGVLESDWQPVDDPRCGDGPCPGAAQHDHRDVTIVLGKPLRGSLLVVRGCLGCSVSTSSDGRHFTTAATAPFGGADDVLVKALRGELVEAVRVQTDTGGFFDRLREVSVFGAAGS
jgi:hypothetical protein